MRFHLWRAGVGEPAVSDLSQLQDALNDARASLESVRKEISDEDYRMMRAFKEQVAKELASRFGDKFKAAQEAYASAVRAELLERDRIARSGENAKYPVGSKFRQWRTERWQNAKKPTGLIGIMEIITTDSLHPGNVSYRANVGDAVIRHLKKDGTPSTRYDRMSYSDNALPWDWLPDVVDPNKVEV